MNEQSDAFSPLPWRVSIAGSLAAAFADGTDAMTFVEAQPFVDRIRTVITFEHGSIVSA